MRDEDHEGERAHLVLVSPTTVRSSLSGKSSWGGTGDRCSTSSTSWPPTSSRATSFARTSPSSSAASTPCPTYVGEFLLGRYCATTDPDEIAEGLAIVERSMKERTVRAGEEELFKSRAREKGKVKIIDLLRARLDAQADAYKAELPSLQLNDIHISDQLVNEHDRMLTGGFYAEVTLEYIAALGRRPGGQPFRVESVRPIQMSTSDALDTFVAGPCGVSRSTSGAASSCAASVSNRPASRRASRTSCSPVWSRSSGKLQRCRARSHGALASHTCSSRSLRTLIWSLVARPRSPTCSSTTPLAGAVSSPSTTWFASTRYQASPSTRRKASTSSRAIWSRASSAAARRVSAPTAALSWLATSMSMCEDELRRGHLFGPMPKEMRDDTAFHDRIHAYLPGWDVPEARPVVLHRPLWTS